MEALRREYCRLILRDKTYTDIFGSEGENAMKTMDEMDRNIQMRSEVWGYKAALLSLCIWTLFNMYQTIVNGMKLEMLPCIILCLSLCIQYFSQIALKRKMIAGDEEYKEPNKFAQAIITSIIIVVVVLSVGTYLLQRV